jgi:hypothetical protein
MPTLSNIMGGTTVYFLASPYFTGETGTYLLDVNVVKSQGLSSEKEILAFTLPGMVGSAVINSANATVDLTVSSSTNVTSLQPNITVSGFASSNPASQVAMNFSSPVNYLVIAQDNSTKMWKVTVTKQAENGLNKVSGEAISVFPNPVSDHVLIIAEGNLKINSASLCDVNGKLIRGLDCLNDNDNFRCGLSGLSAGVYLLQIHTSEGVQTKKIVVAQ